MAGKPVVTDGLSANFAGMTKNQLYEIMSQMKTLIEQNQPQARQILIQNPALTKGLFQAQIMLGMVQPPQAIPIIQQVVPQGPQASALPAQPSNIQPTPSLPGQAGLQEQGRKQQPNQPIPVSSAPVSLNPQVQSLPPHPFQSVPQPKGHIGPQATSPVSLPQPSQIPNMSPHQHHAGLQPPSHLQSTLHSASTQLKQQPMQSGGIAHIPLQPPLPPQPRPPIQAFPHHVHPQLGPNMGFQQSNMPPMHHPQPIFHPGGKPPASMGPQFIQGQPPHPNQPPPQSIYQVRGSHIGAEFNQGRSSMQPDRGSPWIPGLTENTQSTQLSGPLPFPGALGPGNLPAESPGITSELESALLQQVMSITPEQIAMLPPDQRAQVLHLQLILRK